jgi:hypothetical protein
LNLLKLQKEIKRLNEKYPNIHYGGCGIFSYHLSSKLDEIGVDNELVYLPEEYFVMFIVAEL